MSRKTARLVRLYEDDLRLRFSRLTLGCRTRSWILAMWESRWALMYWLMASRLMGSSFRLAGRALPIVKPQGNSKPPRQSLR